MMGFKPQTWDTTKNAITAGLLLEPWLIKQVKTVKHAQKKSYQFIWDPDWIAMFKVLKHDFQLPA